ncbi:MAG: hypothetical protein HY538_02445 [Deltaproteobacteria bacterium]|nr:hypothetical protein [Deltaproteobacteria bacterium]
MTSSKEKEKGGMSRTAYARHRGVRLRAVQKAIESGRISTVTDSKGNLRMDPEVADREWEENTDPALQREPPIEGESLQSYRQAKAMREKYEAKLAKLEYEIKCGKYVAVDQVRTEAFEVGRKVREALLNLPKRLSEELAAEGDSHKVFERLNTEIHKALEELSHGRE